MFAKTLITIVVVSVLVPGWLLLKQAGGNFEYFKEAYDLAVIQSLVGPIEAIVAGLVAYSFGKYTAMVINNKNLMADKRDPESIR